MIIIMSFMLIIMLIRGEAKAVLHLSHVISVCDSSGDFSLAAVRHFCNMFNISRNLSETLSMASDIHPLPVCPSLRGREVVHVCMWGGRTAGWETDTTDIETEREVGRETKKKRERE